MVFRTSSHNKKFKKFADLISQLKTDQDRLVNVD